MKIKFKWIKYLSPIVGILLCPVTILFLWTIWSGPEVNSQSDLVEEVNP